MLPTNPADSATIEAASGDRGGWRMLRPAIWIIALVSALAWSTQLDAVDWRAVVALVVLGNLADLYAVRVQRGMRVSSAHFAAPFAIVAAGVAGGIVVAVGCLLGRLLFNRRDWNSFDVAVNVAAASIAALTWQALGGVRAAGDIVSCVAVVAVFALVRMMVNYGWTLEARSRGIAIPPLNARIAQLMLACAALFTPAVSLFADQRADPVSAVVLLALPFLATQYMIRAFGRERELNTSLEEANVSLTESLVNALDARDPYSAGHSVAVAVYARDIAVEIGLEPGRVQRLYLAGLLHDVGKIAVPDAILRKPAALTAQEFDEIKKHPVVGEQILAPSSHFRDILPAVRHHHERMDGKGYPDALVEEEIPLEARIIAVADAYNAMTSERPYRDAMPPELAVRILVQNQGLQHDPFLVSAFQRIVAARSSEYAVGEGPDFATSHNLHAIIETGSVPHLRQAS